MSVLNLRRRKLCQFHPWSYPHPMWGRMAILPLSMYKATLSARLPPQMERNLGAFLARVPSCIPAAAPFLRLAPPRSSPSTANVATSASPLPTERLRPRLPEIHHLSFPSLPRRLCQVRLSVLATSSVSMSTCPVHLYRVRQQRRSRCKAR